VDVLVAIAIAVGILGVLVPVLPGLLLVAAAVGAWALANEARWLLAAVLVITAVAMAIKIAVPARTARDAASTAALAVGAAAALVGFFVVPVIGMIVGFLLGVLATEVVRLRDPGAALRATWSTARSVGIAIAVELAAAVAIAGLWVAALVAG